MKKILFIFALLGLLTSLATVSVKAGGDKVRGEEGAGEVVQECIRFESCPYGDESPAH